MQSWKDMSRRRKLAVAALAVAVAIGAAFAADQLLGDDAETKPTRAQGEPREYTKPTGKRLELGEVAKISDNYSVAVTELVVYVSKDSQLLAATIKAEYIGKEEGEPWADLSAEYTEANGWTAGEASCPASIESESGEPLTVGDVTTHVACMDLRSRNVKGGRVYVEEALAKGGKRTAWSTDDAVTKELPPPPPDSVVGTGGPSMTSWQAPNGGSKADEDEIEEFEEWKDGIREYKEWTDDVDKNIEKYAKKEKVDDWREWKEDFDEDYEEWEKVYGD